MHTIPASASDRPLVFFMADSANHVSGKTGLSPTVVLSKNGGTFASPSGAVTEIGNGFYKVAGNATDTATKGILALYATASGADPSAMAFSVVGADEQNADSLGLSRLDATVASRLASATYSAPPAASSVADAVWDEALSGHATAGTAGAALTASGAAGDPWATTVPGAYEDGTAGAALGRLNNTPADEPVTVVPTPPADASLTTVYCYTENIVNAKRAGIEFTFRLVTTPAKSERMLEVAAQIATTDSEGLATITLQRGLQYRVVCAALGLDDSFTPTGSTFDLISLLE